MPDPMRSYAVTLTPARPLGPQHNRCYTLETYMDRAAAWAYLLAVECGRGEWRLAGLEEVL